MPDVAAPPAGVLGGAALRAQDYVDFLAAEYLADYVASGGAAVKVAVAGDGGVADRLEAGLSQAAADRRCHFVTVSAEATRVHLIDQVFFAIAGGVDWDAVAAGLVREAYDAVSFPVPAEALTVAEVADHHDVDVRELYRSVRRQLEQTLLGDPTLAREMRRALLRLAQHRLGAGDVDDAEAQAVLGWLRGDKVPLRSLRPALIYGRIGRHNARSMLVSLGRLLRYGGAGGLVLHLDYARLAEARRPPVEDRSGIYYSKAATLDAYEVLRQLIDDTDDLCGMLVVAVVPPELLTDEARGLSAYSALQLRVVDEVRDRRRPNPFAALVRLEVRLEAVP